MNEEPKTLWNRHYIMVLVFGFLTGTAGQMVGPLLSKYSISLGASLALAASLVGLIHGGAIVIRPLAGAAADLLNRKHVMLFSIGLYIIAYSGYLLFPTIPCLVVCRVIQGFGSAMLGIARVAFSTEFIPRDRMGEGVTLNSFGVVLSQALGPGIGLWISERWGYRACFLIALVCISIGAILLSTLPYRKEPRKGGRFRVRFSDMIEVRVISYGVLVGIFAVITNLANSFVALLGDERGIPNVALFFTVYAVLALLTRPVSGKILDKYGLPVLLYPAFIFAALCYVLLGTAQSLLFILLAAVCKTLSQGVAVPSIQGTAVKRYGKEHAGVIIATLSIVQDGICWVAPTVAGFLATDYGYAKMFYIFAAVSLLGIPVYLLIRRKEKKQGIS